MSHSDPDWTQIRHRIAVQMRRQLDVDHAVLEDLVQEACMRLLRALRKKPDVETSWLVSVIARRTAMDHLRRVYRHRELVEAAQNGDVKAALPSVIDPVKGDILERLQFVVCALFERMEREQCRDLALAWFDERSWREVAGESGESHTAVRKRWSRCVEEIRATIDRDPHLGPFLGWSLRS